MVKAASFLLVLFLALGAHSLSAKKCYLTGRWVNDLGSNMTIETMNANGDFAGTYHTAVSATSNEIKVSPLQGSRQRGPNQKGQPTFGFTVNWSFSDSTAVFVGQCFNGEDGKEVLHTSWLLREKVDSQPDDWKATRTGRNTFTRI
ncbi:AVID protein, partial [Aegithalos caudatus]|nr:AVID protein [Aegithalos caudatus]